MMMYCAQYDTDSNSRSVTVLTRITPTLMTANEAANRVLPAHASAATMSVHATNDCVLSIDLGSHTATPPWASPLYSTPECKHRLWTGASAANTPMRPGAERSHTWMCSVLPVVNISWSCAAICHTAPVCAENVPMQ